jgi:hypothetical protein
MCRDAMVENHWFRALVNFTLFRIRGFKKLKTTPILTNGVSSIGISFVVS